MNHRTALFIVPLIVLWLALLVWVGAAFADGNFHAAGGVSPVSNNQAVSGNPSYGATELHDRVEAQGKLQVKRGGNWVTRKTGSKVWTSPPLGAGFFIVLNCDGPTNVTKPWRLITTAQAYENGDLAHTAQHTTVPKTLTTSCG